MKSGAFKLYLRHDTDDVSVLALEFVQTRAEAAIEAT